MASVPERHRRETYDGVVVAADSNDRTAERDYVVGVGPAGSTLARLTIRRQVRSALDLGTGPGFQALLAARHADRVVGVDINPRALEYAAYNAELNGLENLDWRLGSWFEPVAGERFDLVVANPPYVVSPEDHLTYRDSGEPGDALVLRLLGELPAYLDEGGFGQVLCNWIPRGEDWRSPIEEAVAGQGCDLVILRYSETEPEEYARQWNDRLRQRDHAAFDDVVARWAAHYRELGIDSIAFGLAALRRRSGGANWVRAIAVPGWPTEGAGDHLERLFTGRDWELANRDGSVRPEHAPGARVVRRLELETGTERTKLDVKPTVGFAAPLSDGWPPRAAEVSRLIGLGMLLTPTDNGRKIAEA
jgi:methylase of polypeptide subunit release factors